MVKVISLSNDAYGKLKALKRDGSFSDIVIELVDKKKRKKRNIMDFFGIWKEDADEWETIKKKIYEDRKRAKLRDVRL